MTIRRRVARALACVFALVAAGCAPEATSERPTNVLLITVDTLRADHLGVSGYQRETSPRIDALARSGVYFRDVSVQWPKTWPSMASLLSGAYPTTTGIRGRPRRLPRSLLMMGEIFDRAGYTTMAVVANINVGRAAGFDQGFHRFVESWKEALEAAGPEHTLGRAVGAVKQHTNATLVTDQALRWLATRSDSEPFFLWLHYIDPHGPYVPPAEYAALFDEAEHTDVEIPESGVPRYQLQRDAAGRPIRALSFYTAQYDREIRYLDDQLARLLDRLGEMRLEEDTLVVLTADHGESLGEHDYYLGHGMLSYQPGAAVPLIFSQPARIQGGRTVDTPVGLIDAAATIVELAGLPVPPTFEGTSLAPVVLGESGASGPRHVYMESVDRASRWQHTIRDGPFKLIRSQPDSAASPAGTDHFELYDLARDPGERENLARQEPERVAALDARLQAWLDGAGAGPGLDSAEESQAPDADGALDPGARQMLEALGYLEPELWEEDEKESGAE